MPKKRRIFAFIATVLASILLPSVVLASVITNAQYVGTVRVTNNSTAASGVSVPFSLNTAQLVTLGYVSNNLSNSAIRSSSGGDIAYMPAPPNGTAWPLFVENIGASTATDLSLYLGGNTTMSSKIRYFPAATGMTVLDNSTLEPSDNFSIVWSGYINTDNGTAKNLVSKTNALTVYVSPTVSGNITAVYSQLTGAQTENLLPDSAGDYTNVSGGGVPHWAQVDDPVGAPDDGATIIATANTSYEKDAYNIQATAIPTGSTINSVTVYFRFRNAGGGTAYVTPGLRLGGVETTGTEVSVATSIYTNFSEALSRPGGGSWTAADFNSLQVVVSLKGAGGASNFFTQVYVIIDYIPYQAIVTATGVTTGEHSIEVSADSTNLTIIIDGIVQDSQIGGSVNQTASDWVFLQNNVMPYADNITVSVNGTQRGIWNWEYALTFTDNSGNGNTATPSFRTASSDPDVSANLTSLSPITSAEATGWTVSSYGSMVSQVPSQPSGMYTELQTSALPGNQFVTDVFGSSNTPVALFWFTVPFTLMVVLGLLIFSASRSLFAQFGVMFIIVLAFAMAGVIPYWPLYVFALDGIGLMVISKSYGW